MTFPLFNEAQTIATVVERVQAVPIDQEIVLVDDASSDGTATIINIIASSRVRVLHHPANQGKGAAVRTALAAAMIPRFVAARRFETKTLDFLKEIK